MNYDAFSSLTPPDGSGSGWSARSLAGGVLSSVARAADDNVRRVGKSLHARVTGRQSFEDAVRTRGLGRRVGAKPESRERLEGGKEA